MFVFINFMMAGFLLMAFFYILLGILIIIDIKCGETHSLEWISLVYKLILVLFYISTIPTFIGLIGTTIMFLVK